MPRARTLHYSFALWSSVFILISAVTGLMWAYAPYLYWQNGYMEKHAPGVEIPLDRAILAISDVWQKAESLAGGAGSITLRSDAGVLLYDVALKEKTGRLLIDAQSGAILSPVSEELAAKIARQYVAGPASVRRAELLKGWEDRKGKVFPSVWKFQFSDEKESEVFVDEGTGQVLEAADKVRRFHFWVMKLHQFNFFGTHKVLSAVSGVPLLVLLVTGMILGLKRLRLGSR